MIKLVISDSEGSTTVVPLVRDEISIGRKDGNTIRLTERNVSRHHAQLRRENGIYKLKDLDSYVGTLVNGARVAGEAEVAPGDTIAIGDYQIVVEREGEAKPAPPLEDEPTRVAQVRLPARLVMLGAPNPGEEFSLPEGARARIGRGEELEIRIDHRSVSREHAVIEHEADKFLVRDLGSSNGVRVDGVRVQDAPLASGDVIELGEVLLRFVAAGEPYVFDASEATRYAPRHRRLTLVVAGALTLVALGVAIGVVSSGEEEPDDTVEATPIVEVSEPSAEPEPEPATAPTPADEAGYARGVEACQGALAALRFAEAIAHANDALAIWAEGTEAQACRGRAERGHAQEQVFVRGKAALEAGDAEAAHRAFSALEPASPFRSRPEVARAIEELGEARVSRARSMLGRDAAGATALAGSVLELPGMPEAIQDDARQLLSRAQSAAEPRSAASPAPSPAPRRAAAAPSSSGGSAMQTASECLARGDNACVVRALRGRASNAQELGLLIETYRAMGAGDEAEKHMRLYVKRYPTSRRAAAYRKMLEAP